MCLARPSRIHEQRLAAGVHATAASWLSEPILSMHTTNCSRAAPPLTPHTDPARRWARRVRGHVCPAAARVLRRHWWVDLQLLPPQRGGPYLLPPGWRFELSLGPAWRWSWVGSDRQQSCGGCNSSWPAPPPLLPPAGRIGFATDFGALAAFRAQQAAGLSRGGKGGGKAGLAQQQGENGGPATAAAGAANGGSCPGYHDGSSLGGANMFEVLRAGAEELAKRLTNPLRHSLLRHVTPVGGLPGLGTRSVPCRCAAPAFFGHCSPRLLAGGGG